MTQDAKTSTSCIIGFMLHTSYKDATNCRLRAAASAWKLKTTRRHLISACSNTSHDTITSYKLAIATFVLHDEPNVMWNPDMSIRHDQAHSQLDAAASCNTSETQSHAVASAHGQFIVRAWNMCIAMASIVLTNHAAALGLKAMF